MVYRLKSDNSEAAWYFYANLLLENTNIKFQNYKALIPIPSAKKNSVHANLFAKEISRITGLPVLDILSKKTGAIEQKRRSAFDRENEVTISLKTQQVELFTKYIFVDDILTTGQSFLQSNRVVNDSNQNIIITLFYRAKAQ